MRIEKVKGESERAAAPALTSLTSWIASVGVTKTTAWRWRQKGWLRVTNIAGKLYMAAEDAAEFYRRAKAGEFSQEPQTPKRIKEAA